MNSFSYFNKGITVVPDMTVTLEDIYTLTRSDKCKLRCEQIRAVSAPDLASLKKARNVIKKELPGFTVSGIFKSRKIEGLTQFSNYAAIDIDGYRPDELIAELRKSPFVHLMFTSPSGDGLKIVIRVPDKEFFNAYVQGFYTHLMTQYDVPAKHLDTSTCDISRVCFLSHDSSVYYNSEAITFDQKQVEKSNNEKKDDTRSAREMRKVLSLLYAGYTREEVFEEMLESVKWRDAPEAYREYTFKKAQEWYATHPPDAKNKKSIAILLTKKLMEDNKFVTTNEERPEMYMYKDGIYVNNAANYIKEYVASRMGDYYTSNIAQQAIDTIQANTFMLPIEFFKEEPPELIPVQNGILHLLDKKLIPFSPKYRFFNKLPVTYDPSKKCDATLQHFNTVLEPKDILMMQELYGYLLYRDYKFEKIWIFSGDGGNGKGKTIEQMRHLLGEDNCSCITLQSMEEDKFMLGGLFKKLANIGADVGKATIKETRNLKSSTGHDLIECDQKFKSTRKFVNYAKQIFAANQIPQIDDTSEALGRRLIFVRFEVVFKGASEYERLQKANLIMPKHRLADTAIAQKLTQQDELSGVLNWALEGFVRLMKQNDFSYSKSEEETRYAMKKYSSPVLRFASECLVNVPDKDQYEVHEDLYNSFIKYCRHPKRNLQPTSEKEFKAQLQQYEQLRLVRQPVYQLRWYFLKLKKEAEWP